MTAVALSPDSSLIASCSNDNSVKIWDIVGGKLLKSLEGSKSLGVKDIAFNPTKFCLAASGGDRRIRYYDLQDFNLITTTSTDMTPSMKIKWTPDGEYLYACSNNNVRVLDLEKDQVLDIICKPNYKVLDLKVTS